MEDNFEHHGLTHDSVTLKYVDHVGYHNIIDSTDLFIRDKIIKQLLQATIAIGKEVIAKFEELEATLDPVLPSWRPLVAQWFKDTTGRVS